MREGGFRVVQHRAGLKVKRERGEGRGGGRGEEDGGRSKSDVDESSMPAEKGKKRSGISTRRHETNK